MTKGDRTKRHIIEQSSSLFNKNGYKATSISEIMTATGLKKGGIYNHFGNKEAIAEAAFFHSTNTLKEKYKEAFATKETAFEQFEAFTTIFASLFDNSILAGGCPLMNAAIEADDSSIEFTDSIKAGFYDLINAFRRMIDFGKKRREIKPEIQSEQMAILLISSLEGALMLSRLYNDPYYLNMTIAHFKNHLFT